MDFNTERARILVVDDEPANLKVMREVLGDQYRLSFAKSGDAALALVAKELPKLILLDIMMPNMSGFEVCQRLKETRKHNIFRSFLSPPLPMRVMNLKALKLAR